MQVALVVIDLCQDDLHAPCTVAGADGGSVRQRADGLQADASPLAPALWQRRQARCSWSAQRLGLAASSPSGIAETKGAQPTRAQPTRTARGFQHGTAHAPEAIVYVRGKGSLRGDGHRAPPRWRECDLAAALAESLTDIAAGGLIVESVDADMMPGKATVSRALA